MSDELSLPRILPIGAIIFEILFLLVAIPIEGYILHKQLKFDKKSSIFYSLGINVFSSVIGWNMFFMAEPILPVRLKSEIISYVFFNNFINPRTMNYMIMLSFLVFLGTFLVKFLLMKLLIMLLNEIGREEDISNSSQRQKLFRIEKMRIQNSNLLTTILVANSLSYSAITIILVIRNWAKVAM